MAGFTLRGFVPDTDPIYSGGSTIIVGPNLNHTLAEKLVKQKAAEEAKGKAKGKPSKVPKRSSPAR